MTTYFFFFDTKLITFVPHLLNLFSISISLILFIMNIHEYQGKAILASYGVRVQRGIVANSPVEAVAAAKQLTAETGTGWHVIKAQIRAGGRGKGKIKGTEQRGVALAKNLDDVKTISGNILGGTLVTLQTGEAGKVVNQVLIAQDVYYPGPSPTKEFYVSILLDRQVSKNVIIYSTEGGMDIEEVAHNTPHLIFKEHVDPAVGLMPFQARKIACIGSSAHIQEIGRVAA